MTYCTAQDEMQLYLALSGPLQALPLPLTRCLCADAELAGKIAHDVE